MLGILAFKKVNLVSRMETRQKKNVMKLFCSKVQGGYQNPGGIYSKTTVG